MKEVQLTLQPNGKGTFGISNGEEQIAKIEIGIKGNIMTVYHTQVAEKAEGKGFAKKLFAAMVLHADHLF